mmetsp:Transcript_40411/g.96027  ORF Transcript_40411/g.96027 Transcript_40411/m.96027 type:complete len:514 (+) Transcript_40411:1076-2617(+)|eukprot:CAMPEP_0177600844 /NCGR_PEP_ID=MMETSP0419_2-20121207/13896_1 /TAXON_ID=582737 /ORGANISM="Tetraselmis sp., Strain GSL018" /LENGTH=513 /DNA_ID=CAMNT_0019093977 /DNA_START=596 /DNA_END=2137 /DNA_ORIENTATION=-
MTVSFSLTGHSDKISGVAYRPGVAHHVASSSASGDVLLHNTKDGLQPVNLSPSNRVPKLGLSCSAVDTSMLAVAAQDGSALLYDVTPGVLKSRLELHEGPVTGLCFSPRDGSTLFSVCAEDNTIAVSDTRSRQVASRSPTGFGGSVVAAHEDGRWLAVGCRGGRLLLYDARKMAAAAASVAAASNAAVRHISFQPRGGPAPLPPGPAEDAGGAWGTAAPPPACAPEGRRAAGPQETEARPPVSASPAAFGGISPVGAGLSFTPVQGTHQNTGAGDLLSTRRKGRVPEAEIGRTSSAAAREAASLYYASTPAGKPPHPAAPAGRAAQPNHHGNHAEQSSSAAGQVPPPRVSEAPAAAVLQPSQGAARTPATPKLVSLEGRNCPPQAGKENHAAKEGAQTGDPSEARGGAAEEPSASALKTPWTLNRAQAGPRRDGDAPSAAAFQQLLDSRVEGLRDDIRDLHIELLRQFHVHQAEMVEAFTAISKRQDALSEEISQLRTQMGRSQRRQLDSMWL